jgi:hypothetical protein
VPIRKYTIDPPFAHQGGDTYAREGNILKQIRGGITVDARTVSSGPLLTAQEHIGGGQVTAYYEEQRMPGQNVSCTKVTENQTTGAVTFSFSSGTNLELSDWAAVGFIADSLDGTPEFAEKILMLKAYRASPDGANKTNQVGAAVSINGLADTPVVYTEPE